METKGKNNLLKISLYIVSTLCISGILFHFIRDFIDKPSGFDIYGYLFRVEELYKSMKIGDFFPIYTNKWYNGTELFRSWPPFVYYILSLFTFIFNGNVFSSYYLFIVLSFFITMMGTLKFGVRNNRIFLSFICGILLFILPDNLRVLMSEGNVARVFITSLVPFLVYYIDDYLVYNKKFNLVKISIIILIITLSHFMIAAMCGLAIFIYCVVDFFINGDFRRKLVLLFNVVFSYLLASVYLIPGLFGGMLGLSRSADSELSMWLEDFSVSLNSFERWFNPNGLNLFYFSNVLLIFIILAICCRNKRVQSFFITGLIIFLLTSSELMPIFKLLPFSQIFWMKRLIPIAYVFVVVGILNWKELRKSIFALFIVLILLDIIPSFGYFKYNKNFDNVYSSALIDKKLEEQMDAYLVNDALEICDKKIAIIDESLFGSVPSYYIPKKDIEFINGWGLQGATTRQLIVNINESYKNGYYYYCFDRLVEIGADTVIFYREFLPNENIEDFVSIGKSIGYNLVDENNNALLFKLETNIDGYYGTISEYSNIAIGESSYYIQYLYPDFASGDSYYLDDYTFDELSQYERIFISGFKYHDKAKAELLVRQLAKNNTKVIIDMNNIPENKVAGKDDFLGVFAEEINFNESFPVIENEGHQFKLDFENEFYSNWKTVYLNGNIIPINSSSYFTYPNLVYWGVDEDTRNVNFIGFNLIYYCVENKNEDLVNLFNRIFDLSENVTPSREIVPIEIEYNLSDNYVLVNSKYDNVNINLAKCDVLTSYRQLSSEDNLIILNSGETTLKIEYPMLKVSILATLVGIFLLGLTWLYVFFIDKGKIVNN